MGNLRSIAALEEAGRWLDLRVLDLRYIGLLQTIGSMCAIVSVAAVREGQYVALIPGLAAGLCISAATLWFLALLPCHGYSRPPPRG